MAEGAPLLRVYTLTRIEGSNPSLSAIYCIATAGIRIGIAACRKADSNPRFKQAGFDREVRQRVAEASAGSQSLALRHILHCYCRYPDWQRGLSEG